MAHAHRQFQVYAVHASNPAEPNANRDTNRDCDSITQSIAIAVTDRNGNAGSDAGALRPTNDVRERREYRDYR